MRDSQRVTIMDQGELDLVAAAHVAAAAPADARAAARDRRPGSTPEDGGAPAAWRSPGRAAAAVGSAGAASTARPGRKGERGR
jgi:hypothetical protein